MKNKKIRFNVLDFSLIFCIALIVFSAVFRGIAVDRFEEDNAIEEVIITLKLTDADEMVFDEIRKGDYFFSNELFGEGSIGVVNKKMKHSSSQKLIEDEHDESELIEYEVQLSSECLRSSKGFYSINDKLIIPGMVFSSDNGYVGFDCEVLSIKTVD